MKYFVLMLSFKNLIVLHKSLLLLFIANSALLSVQETPSATLQPSFISHQIRAFLETGNVCIPDRGPANKPHAGGGLRVSHLHFFFTSCGQMEKILDEDTMMMVSESCKGHRFFSATLHGEASSAHEEGKHGPHQRG